MASIEAASWLVRKSTSNEYSETRKTRSHLELAVAAARDGGGTVGVGGSFGASALLVSHVIRGDGSPQLGPHAIEGAPGACERTSTEYLVDGRRPLTVSGKAAVVTRANGRATVPIANSA